MASSDHLAFERKWAPIAAVATVFAGLLPIVGLFLRRSLFNEAPSQPLLDGLQRAIAGQPLTNRAGQVLTIDEKSGGWLTGSAFLAVGGLLALAPFWYLHRATQARTPDPKDGPSVKLQWPKFAGYLAFAGPILGAIGLMFAQIAFVDSASSFADSGLRTPEAANDFRVNGSLTDTAVLVGTIASLALALSFVLISLNAMRVGLLTRFMGVLGILIGAFSFFTGVFGETGLFLPAFWFPALAPLFLLRWPSGQPPAWKSGRAEPWPSQQQVREQRMAAQKERQKAKLARPERRPAEVSPEEENGAAKPTRDATGTGTAAKPHPVSKKKRKKR